MKTLDHLIERNRAWADGVNRDDPDFFSRLGKQQRPPYLWIGCSDSRVPASSILDLPPGEVFVHRNIANQVVETDMNSQSVIHFAVGVLKVRHIIVCGHYGCGGIMAATEAEDHGLVDHWLCHIKVAGRVESLGLDSLDASERLDRLCEENVREQVRNVCQSQAVRDAWQGGAALSVHGMIYNIHNGLLTQLCEVNSPG